MLISGATRSAQPRVKARSSSPVLLTEIPHLIGVERGGVDSRLIGNGAAYGLAAAGSAVSDAPRSESGR